MMKYILLVALVAVAQAGKVDFVDCGHKEMKSLDVSGCQGKGLCIIHKGKKLHLGGDLTCNQDSDHLHLKIVAEVNGIEVELPGGYEKDACKFVQCPVHKGKPYHFDVDYDVPKALPNIKANITAKVTGDHGLVACVKIQGEVTD